MKKIWDKIIEKFNNQLKSKFAKSVLMITGGTIFAQVLNTVLSPLLTRIYSPEEFGTLTLFSSILILMSFSYSFSYELSIPIAEDDNKAINALALCFSILFFTTIFITIILYFAGNFILNVFNADVLINYKYFIPIGFLFSGIYAIFSQWAFRKKDFKALAKTKFFQSIAGNITKILLGLLSFGNSGLIIGYIIKTSAGVTTLAKPIYKNERFLLKHIDLKEIFSLAKRYVRFPIYTAPTKLLLTLSSHLPVIFFTAFYSPSVVGFYGLAKSITFLPMTFIGKSIEDVFYGEVASIGKNNSKKIKELYNKLLQKLFFLALFPTIILVLFAPFLFSFIFGDNWFESGVYSRYYAFYVFTYLIFHPTSSLFFIFEKQHIEFILNISNLLAVIVVFFTSYCFKLSPSLTVAFYSIAKSTIEIIRYLMIKRILVKSN